MIFQKFRFLGIFWSKHVFFGFSAIFHVFGRRLDIYCKTTLYNPSYNPTYNSAYSGSSILPSNSNPNVLNSSNSKLIPKPERFVLENFDFLPQTYILPQDRDKLRREWSDGTRFISKPCASARGIGIKVLNKFSQLPTVFKNERMSANTNRKLLVQKYLQKPMLLNGHKYDLHTVYSKLLEKYR